ncbi:hypothetical protein SDC9_157877 [bioreactor metagenome]|uniref:Uncharacterized protein n=1 Tax=bioreactor metagenome TaxID=1076179 RepID=A0A645FAJ5_9ZZZZ
MKADPSAKACVLCFHGGIFMPEREMAADFLRPDGNMQMDKSTAAK